MSNVVVGTRPAYGPEIRGHRGDHIRENIRDRHFK